MTDDSTGSGSDMTPPPGPPPSHANPPPAQPPGYQAAPAQSPTYGPGGAPRTNGLAVAGFVLGLLWLCYIGSILGVIFGHVALSQIKKSNGMQTGAGLAIAGLVLGYLGLSAFIFLLISGAASMTFGV